MEQPQKQWPPVPGIQQIPDGKRPVTLQTNQAIGLSDKLAKAIHKAMEEFREQEKGTTRVRDPLSTRIKSFRGWRTKEEFDLVHAGIAGA
ncbi:MAG: hypothetical protein RLZZ347_226 [Candidatus Parcubacteria bacterium]|jgi:hypothetical protein